MLASCHFCRLPMTLPDEVAYTGGTFTCPSCHRPSSYAASVAPLAAKQGATQDNRARNIAIAIVATCAFAWAVPTLGLLLGLGLIGWAAAALAGKVGAPFRLFFTGSNPVLLAVGSLAIGLLVSTCAGMGIKSKLEDDRNAEREEAARAEAARVAAEMARDREDRAAALVVEAEALIASGDVSTAQSKLGEAQELDADDERLRGASDALERVRHEQALATMPTRIATIKTLSHKAAWSEAHTSCTEATAIQADYDGLAELCAPVRDEVEKLNRARAVEDALAVAGDASKCDTPREIQQAWDELKKIRKDDPIHKHAVKAAAKLEKCRKHVETQLDKGLRDVMVQQRKNFAEQIEVAFLDDGIDFEVTLKGKHKDQLRIKWVLMGRAAVHAMTSGTGFLENAEKAGFKRVTFTDGFYESLYYDLDPQSEGGGGKAVLAPMGLDQPLKL